MKENGLLLAEFVQEDGFELNQYLTNLFNYFSEKTDAENSEPTL